jgi:hypothetical protein
MGPIMLLIFLFIGNVMLFNLLIALLSAVYEDNRSEAKKLYAFELARTIQERTVCWLSDATVITLPAPLSLSTFVVVWPTVALAKLFCIIPRGTKLQGYVSLVNCAVTALMVLPFAWVYIVGSMFARDLWSALSILVKIKPGVGDRERLKKLNPEAWTIERWMWSLCTLTGPRDPIGRIAWWVVKCSWAVIFLGGGVLKHMICVPCVYVEWNARQLHKLHNELYHPAAHREALAVDTKETAAGVKPKEACRTSCCRKSPKVAKPKVAKPKVAKPKVAKPKEPEIEQASGSPRSRRGTMTDKLGSFTRTNSFTRAFKHHSHHKVEVKEHTAEESKALDMIAKFKTSAIWELQRHLKHIAADSGKQGTKEAKALIAAGAGPDDPDAADADAAVGVRMWAVTADEFENQWTRKIDQCRDSSWGDIMGKGNIKPEPIECEVSSKAKDYGKLSAKAKDAKKTRRVGEVEKNLAETALEYSGIWVQGFIQKFVFSGERTVTTAGIKSTVVGKMVYFEDFINFLW